MDEHGKPTTYKRYHSTEDPQEDLTRQLDTHVLRVRGRLDGREAVEYKAMMKKEGAGK